jgi:pimeloyl-[acyl-carrier protein] methyl ester esterase
MSDRLKIITRGQGPDLVLLHGWAMHSGIWGGVVDALATEFRVNLVDLPGHGINRNIRLSRDLKSLAKLILSELLPAAWMGWSLGGLVTLAAALQQPAMVQKMVLVGATPSFSRQQGWDCGVDIESQQAFADGLENDYEETISQFGVRTFGANWVDESLNRLGISAFTEKAPADDVLRTGLHLLYSNNLLPELNTCKTPTLYLGGSRDRTIWPESLAQAASLMPDAISSLISGAGHAPFISHEQEFLEIVHSFLQEKKIS